MIYYVVSKHFGIHQASKASYVVHHNVHASKLRPDLSEETNMGAIDHARTEELHVSDLLGISLDSAPLLDFIEFAINPRTVWVAVAMSKDKDLTALLPAVLGG